MERPLTTVMMPAFNAEATFEESVRSALAQTEGRHEVVVVDDGSRIPVSEALGDIGDDRLRVIRHQRNRGLSAARNTAVRAARAPLVSQLDADDVWGAGLPGGRPPALRGPVHRLDLHQRIDPRASRRANELNLRPVGAPDGSLRRAGAVSELDGVVAGHPHPLAGDAERQ